MSDDKPQKVATGRIFAAGTLLAVVISVPMVTVILVLHYVVNADLIITAGGGIAALFVAMGFGYKLSKKLAKVQGTGTDLERK